MATFPTTGGSFGNSFGSFGGNLLSNYAGVGSNIGGTLGGVAGGALFGPLGALGGSFLGNTVGKLFGFGDKKPEQLHFFGQYDPVADAILAASSNVNGPSNQQLVNMLNQSVMGVLDPVQAMLARMGVDPAPGPLNLGIFRGATAYGGPDVPFTMGLDPRSEDAYELVHDILRGGTVLGQEGDRTSQPSQVNVAQAIAGLGEDLWSRSLSGMTNQDILTRLGLPTELDALQQRLPNVQFGDDFSLDAPFTLKASDMMSLYGGGMLGGLSQTPSLGQMPTNTQQGPNAGNLMRIYQQYQQRMPQGNVRYQPSYYSRWGG